MCLHAQIEDQGLVWYRSNGACVCGHVVAKLIMAGSRENTSAKHNIHVSTVPVQQYNTCSGTCTCICVCEELHCMYVLMYMYMYTVYMDMPT